MFFLRNLGPIGFPGGVNGIFHVRGVSIAYRHSCFGYLRESSTFSFG